MFLNWQPMILVFLSCSHIDSCNSVSDIEVRTPVLDISSGQIQGTTLISRDGKSYSAYLGIPYGEAERFEPARFPKRWGGVKNATSFGSECSQIRPETNEIIGSEHCLVLNVYVPTKADKGLLPVMVWLHPGGYQFGTGNHYHPKYFMNGEAVVLITINYRLSIFGFLDTQDGLAEGNLGLKDQVLALKWVQQNIRVFGGDPEKVTLFGSSAGAASVNFHLISPMSKGLFHRAISQSGSSLVGYVMQMKPLENVKTLSKLVHCPYTSTEESIKCLKLKKPAELLLAVEKFREINPAFDKNCIFTPTVESATTKFPFMIDCPLSSLENGDFHKTIPWLSGVVSNEGAANLDSIANSPDLINDLNKNWNDVAPYLLVYKNKIVPDTSDVSRKIWTYFIGPGEEINSRTWKNLTDTVSDRWNVHGIVKTMRLWSQFGKVYPFYFNYPGNFTYSSHPSIWGSINEQNGVGHIDELQYLFKEYDGAPEYNSSSVGKLSTKFVKLWTTFAKYGYQAPRIIVRKISMGEIPVFSTYSVPKSDIMGEWTPVSASNDQPLHWYEINDEIKLIDDPFKDRVEFWDSIPFIYCPHANRDRDEL